MIILDFKYPNTKKLYLTVEISQLLHKYQCTYNEADGVLQLIEAEIRQQRDDLEYDTVNDYINGHKTNYTGDKIVQPLNHFEPYC